MLQDILISAAAAAAAAAPGANNAESLQQLGFSKSEIDGLRASGTTPQAKERAA